MLEFDSMLQHVVLVTFASALIPLVQRYQKKLSFKNVRIHFRQCADTRSSLPNDDKNPTPLNRAGTSKTDIELTTFEASSIVGDDVCDSGLDTSWTVPHPIRRTKWNEIPYDPVDEVSLKGSSMYLSDGEDDVKAIPYNCHDDNDDDDDDYHSDIRKLQQQWDNMKKI